MSDERSCDVAVIGGGPAGLSAALAAARVGAQVTLVDSQQRLGGQYYRQPAPGREHHASVVQSRGRVLVERALSAGVQVLERTSLWNANSGLTLQLLGPAGVTTLQAKAVVVATGAHERCVAFPGWTLAGVYTAGGVQALLKEHGVVAGGRVVVAGTGPLLLAVAAGLSKAGVNLAGVFEASRPLRNALTRPAASVRGTWGHWAKLAEGASCLATLVAQGVRPRTGWGIVRAHGTTEVTGATVARLDGSWRAIPGSQLELECDTIAIHHGLVPDLAIIDLFGARAEWQPLSGGWVPAIRDTMSTSVPGVFAAGDGTGVGGVGLAAIEGEIAGTESAAYALDRRVSIRRSQRRRLARHRRFRDLYGALFAPRPGLSGLADDATSLCRCEDVTVRDIDRAINLGAHSLGTVKSLTRCGMGNCQGRICGPIVASALGQKWGISEEAVGRYKTRPPLTPVLLGDLTRSEWP